VVSGLPYGKASAAGLDGPGRAVGLYGIPEGAARQMQRGEGPREDLGNDWRGGREVTCEPARAEQRPLGLAGARNAPPYLSPLHLIIGERFRP
jgi:hypothetical protein